MATPHSRRLTPVMALKAASVVLVAVGAVWAGHAAWAAFTGEGTPACSWPLHVRGKPAPGQVGLMRCYLKTLAHRDAAGLLAIAEAPSPVRITKADLRHSADARAGLATVTFAPRVLDPEFGVVGIVYADGARDQLGLQNMISFGGPSVWRLAIGTPLFSGGPSPASSKGPPPAGPGS
jgi:hypothetical protein